MTPDEAWRRLPPALRPEGRPALGGAAAVFFADATFVEEVTPDLDEGERLLLVGLVLHALARAEVRSASMAEATERAVRARGRFVDLVRAYRRLFAASGRRPGAAGFL